MVKLFLPIFHLQETSVSDQQHQWPYPQIVHAAMLSPTTQEMAAMSVSPPKGIPVVSP